MIVPVDYMLFGLLVVILLAPILSHRVEQNLEAFFLAMGMAAATITSKWSWELVYEAVTSPVMLHGSPIGIFQVVLLAGLIFYKWQDKILLAIERASNRLGVPVFVAVVTFALGLASSVISAIVASVIAAELIYMLRTSRTIKVVAGIMAAYAIGAGAALLPIGEPLSTIAVIKLSGEPYNADFFFLVRLLWEFVVPLVALFAVMALLFVRRAHAKIAEDVETLHEAERRAGGLREVFMRAIRVYVFISALVLLGESFEILVEKYFRYLSPDILYLVGAMSAVVDNATLAAAIIGPDLSLFQIESFLLSLIISGGFLIPGNVPNIIVASILGIRFKEWAKLALPIGVPVFLVLFAILFYVM